MKRTPEPTDPLARRVWRERYRRFWSIRDAAEGTGITNQTWSTWEKTGGPPTDKVREAIALRFDWPADWPENPPPIPEDADAEPLSRLEAAVAQLADVVAQQAQVAEIHDQMQMIAEQLAAQGATIERLSGLLDRATGQPQRAAT